MPRKTNKQSEILNFIRIFTDDNGYPPSVREICAAVNLKSPSTVHGHLEKLESQGFLRRESNKTRSVVLNDGYTRPIITPVVGRVTAGQPILAIENIEDYFPLPQGFFDSGEDVFMLRVQGSSMIEAGIFDEDYIVVRKQDSVKNGEIAVVLIGDENATVKRFYKENGHYRLQPENSAMEPIITRDEVHILGLVVGLIRRM